MPFKIERMKVEDIPEVAEIDRISFSTPWPPSAYRREIEHPDRNYYIVLRRVGEGPLKDKDISRHGVLANILPFLKDEKLEPNPNPIIGYAGLWIIGEEAHVTTIAVLPQFRGKKLGELLLVSLIDYARKNGVHRMTLEARVSNHIAQSLYRKYTFKNAGYRRRYYSDNGEDALVMWSDRIDTDEFANKFESLKRELLEKLNGQLLLEDDSIEDVSHRHVGEHIEHVDRESP